MDRLKLCNGCNQELPVDAFNKRMKRGKRVLRSRCRKCTRSDGLANYHAAARNGKEWAKEARQPYHRHHLSTEAYRALVLAQGGICANTECNGPAEVIDHDHGCCPGKYSCGSCVRGLLCQSCNKAEGFLRSDPDLARGLLEYIERSQRL